MEIKRFFKSITKIKVLIKRGKESLTTKFGVQATDVTILMSLALRSLWIIDPKVSQEAAFYTISMQYGRLWKQVRQGPYPHEHSF